MSRLVFKDPERSRLAVEQAVRDARGRGTGALGALIRRPGTNIGTVKSWGEPGAAALGPADGSRGRRRSGTGFRFSRRSWWPEGKSPRFSRPPLSEPVPAISQGPGERSTKRLRNGVRSSASSAR